MSQSDMSQGDMSMEMTNPIDRMDSIDANTVNPNTVNANTVNANTISDAIAEEMFGYPNAVPSTAWMRDRSRMDAFFNDPMPYIKDFWATYKSLFVLLGYAVIALIALNFLLTIIGFITSIPLLEPLFEMIGIGYTGWFVYRYLLDAESRQELMQQINQTKQAILGASSQISAQKINVKKKVIVNKSPADIYKFWRNFENLPRFMNHLQSVRVLDNKRSHWVAKAPMDSTVEWDAEIIDEKENKSIVWRSLAGAEVENLGSVSFTPINGSQTEVKVTMQYNPPGGELGAWAAALFNENPKQQLDEDLQCLKRVLEMSEVAK